jgi:predicted nucleic acid-binding protein
MTVDTAERPPIDELGLLDTSAVVQLRSLPVDALPAEPQISAVTLAELTVGPLVAATEEERSARQAVLQQAEADFEPIPFDAAAARAFGRVAAALRRAGRKATARSHDAMIAATAIANRLPLYTANPHDFEGIAGLDVRVVTSRS